MRAKHTTGMGKEHEEAVVEAYSWANSARSKSSGASMHDPIDVTTDVSVVECEATEAKSYTLKLSFWQEIVEKQHSGRMPMLAVRFRDPITKKHTDLAVLELSELSALQEEVEAYREEAILRS
jgi:hypothetical protein